MVPFFPTDWKKNANDVFNAILNGQSQVMATEDVYDDVTHVAVHRKVGVQKQDALADFFDGEKAVTGDRPTSGKHFARNHDFAKRKGDLRDPVGDPMNSAVAKNYEK